MSLEHDLSRPTRVPRVVAYVAPSGDAGSFRRAVARIERYRKLVRGAVAVALVARLTIEFHLLTLLRHSDALVAQVPYIGTALLAYLLVIMWMAKNAGDRLGFGMALGLGVIEAAYVVVTTINGGDDAMRPVWAPILVALAHLPMAGFALSAASAYPAQDSKGPWILGFFIALALLVIPWVVPALSGIGG